MSTFGDVTYADAATPDAATPAPGEQPTLVDPNDPRLTSEVLTSNVDADAYAVAPTLPAGKWRAKAKQTDIKDAKGQMQRFIAESRAGIENGTPFFATNIELSIIDHTGEFDGVKLTEYWVKTVTDGRKGISQAETMTKKLGGTIRSSSTQAERMKVLLEQLAKEPELIVEVDWQAECMACQDAAKKKHERVPGPFLQGMHRFPNGKGPGEKDPQTSCPVCKSPVRAQARVVRGGYFSLTEAKPTRGTGQPAAK